MDMWLLEAGGGGGSSFFGHPKGGSSTRRHIAYFGTGWMNTAGPQHPDLEQGEPNLRC